MRNKPVFLAAIAIVCILGLYGASADTVVMANGNTISGTAIQTNGDDVLILTKYAAFNFSKGSIKEIKAGPSDAIEASTAGRIPVFQQAILFLSSQSWATNLTPIPATVIDKGILRNVPYTSLRCAGDYEVNIYGDLDAPAGFEIGIYRKLLTDDSAKSNCLKFVTDLLNQQGDKEIVQSLDRRQDLKARDGLTFEITPPAGEDAYNGWWISVYSEKQLNLARASDSEMNLISITQADVAKDVQTSTNPGSWTADDLKQARTAAKEAISFVNSSGELITNAEVVRVIDGVSLIWRNGPTSGGTVRLEDLSQDLRVRFGYDAAKTKAADDLARVNKARWQQEADDAAAAQATAPQYTLPSDDSSGYSDGDLGSGRVFVHGYYKSNGTYVNSYSRNYPNR